MNDAFGILLALAVLAGMGKVLGVKVPKKKRKRTVRRVKVDPLVAKERRLAAELRKVRAELRSRQGTY
ncbi:MAG: hypothetical protein IRZ10_07785 [Thermoflavifilum sp.]|nr:hypothetical protein [Thermoflavifilum sp.]MCL6514310.1 hypothetical protein [Alicyclobacillus sp.]